MSEKTKNKMLRITPWISIVVGIILIVTNFIIVDRYNNLYDQYVDQVIEYNVLVKEHTQLTDAYWSLQQSILKQ